MIIFECTPFKNVITKSIEIFENWTNHKCKLENCLYKIKNISPLNLAELKILNPLKEELNTSPLQPEIDFEKTKIDECKCGKGIIYSAKDLANILKNKIINQVKFSEMPIFITNDFIAEFDKNDRRWHLRYAFFYFPTIISIQGIINAPAKPREYYIYIAKGIPTELMPENLKSKFLTETDKRLPRVLAGIMLQAYAFYILKYPFCDDKNCSLFNAHWQEDLLNSQKDEPYILCDKHNFLLKIN
jgi:hypothetical protein